MNWRDKLKERWKLESGKQVPMILLVFALTGSSVLKVASWVYLVVPVESIEVPWLKTAAKIFMVLVIYQILLIMFGFLTGQSKFFINFVKRIFLRPGTKKSINNDAD